MASVRGVRPDQLDVPVTTRLKRSSGAATVQGMAILVVRAVEVCKASRAVRGGAVGS